MSWKTPLVRAGMLHEVNMAVAIKLDSPAWFAWLADEHHRCFHFAHPEGDFTARKERKQRGQWYWVAYRQVQRKLYKTYLGKTELLTHARLHAAVKDLAEAAVRSIDQQKVDSPHA